MARTEYLFGIFLILIIFGTLLVNGCIQTPPTPENNSVNTSQTGQANALAAIEDANLKIKTAENAGFDVSTAKEKMNEANIAFKNGEYATALQLANEAKIMAENAKNDTTPPVNNTAPPVNLTVSLPPISTLSGKLVIASYYSWYGFKEGETNWISGESVGDTPLVGAYRSDDPKLIDYHLSLAQDIGIDVFLADTAIYESENHQAVIFRQMLDQINTSTRYRNFKMAVYYVGASVNPDITNEELIRDVSHILTEYGDHDAYFQMNGKPVIFFYGSQNVGPERWQQVFDEVSRTTGKQGVYISAPDNWDYDTRFNAFLNAFDGMAAYADKYTTDSDILSTLLQIKSQKPTAPIISTVFGGGGRIQKSGFDINRSDGRYIRQRLDLAKDANADWIEITSWNEWYEYNQVEPNVEYGFETVKYMREAVAEFKGQDLASLSGAALEHTQTGNSLSVTNTGTHNVYYVTYGGSSLIAYVLHPGETTTITISGSLGQVTGYLPDNTVVYSG